MSYGVYSRYHKCSVCGAEFKALRYDADTCGPTCRSKKHRAAKKLADQRLYARMAVHEIAQRATATSNQDDIEELKWIEALAREAILENSRQLKLALGE